MFHFSDAKWNARQRILEVLWSYLHLRPLDRFFSLFPVVPCHSFLTDQAGAVQTIQVGPVAMVVPPSAFIFRGTVSIVLVIVALLGAKLHTTTITQRISSSSWKKEQNTAGMNEFVFF